MNTAAQLHAAPHADLCAWLTVMGRLDEDTLNAL